MEFNKSGLMRKHKNLGAILIVSGVILTVASTFFLGVLPAVMKPATQLWLGDGIFRTDIATTDSAREKGLSDRAELVSNEALLMIFPSEGKWGIWMKGVKFPIDVVWLDSNKKVIYIVKNIDPDKVGLVTYYPKTDAKYVVELPAGTVDGKSIHIGGAAIFRIDSESGE